MKLNLLNTLFDLPSCS